MINIVVDVGLVAMLLGLAVVILRNQSPLSITILSSIYSLILCMLFVVLDAVDVAFTEAAVGAGITTVLIVAVLNARDESDIKPCWPSTLSMCIGLGVGILLLLGTLDMPLYGDPSAPVHQYLVPRFLQQSGEEIGIPNIVTSVLASYRGYDTLGEVVVIFTAGLAVAALLAGGGNNNESSTFKQTELISNPVIKTVIVRIIPIVLLFALYVQFHGDYGPGGGFQAGVIFGAGIITFGLLAGSTRMQKVVPERATVLGMALGILVYAFVGIASILYGGEFLNYSALSESQTSGQHIGILLIELGIGITVASTMVSLFISFNRTG